MQLSGLQILDSIPLSVVVTDLEGRITNTNASLIDLLGRGGDAMVGCPINDISAEDYHAHDTAALQAVKDGDMPYPYVKELITQDGQAVPVEVHVGGVRNKDGVVTHGVFVMKALSEEMQLLRDLQRRTMHLVASAEVAKAATQILDIQELLMRCVDLIRTHFGFYYAAIFLIDEQAKNANLRAATGDAGQKLLEKNHYLGVGSKSMVGWVTANNAARIALDVGEEAIRFDNPLLPKTRAEMALPLRVRGQVLGALDVQSTTVNAFTTEDIQTLQMMADQVAIAIDNARLFTKQRATQVL